MTNLSEPASPHATAADAVDDGFVDEEFDAAERYGRRSGSNVPRWWWIGLILLTLAVIGFWALTSLSPAATVDFQTAGFRVVDENHVELDARISVQAGTELACAVEARTDRDALVGWKVITVPPSTDAHQLVHVSLVTTRTASAVGIRECWPLDTNG